MIIPKPGPQIAKVFITSNFGANNAKEKGLSDANKVDTPESINQNIELGTEKHVKAES